MNNLNNFFNLAGYDGCKHIILSAILTVVGDYLLPLWVVVPIVFAVGLAKEVYDSTGKGYAEWKDVVCNVIGIIIGAL